jgi:hypothetical protein
MGRPLNKKLFGANALPNIKVHFNNGTSGVVGFIVKQKGSKKFLCQSAAGIQATCRLVNKAQASLLPGEMSMTVKLDSGVTGRVTKISAHRLTVNGASYPWSFSASTSDSKAQVEEAGTSTTVISTATGATSIAGA